MTLGILPWRGRGAVLLLGLLSAGACAEISAGVERASHPVPLVRDEPGRDRVGAFTFGGAVEISDAGKELGGLSGLAITDGGRRFVALSDVGRIVSGRLDHTDGRLTGVGDLSVTPLPGIPPRQGRARPNDTEEIVALPDGGWLVSFEGVHRIRHYPPGFGRPAEVPVAAGMADLPLNGGVEALTRLPDGRLLAIAEGLDNGVRERPAWIAAAPLRSPADWGALTYRAAPGFRPTGATVLPGGDVLVLERYFSLLGGVKARIVRVAQSSLKPGAIVEGEELAMLEPPLLLDNYEGIAAVPGPAGETLVYVVSDNNFNSTFQRTYLLLLVLPDRRLAEAP